MVCCSSCLGVMCHWVVRESDAQACCSGVDGGSALVECIALLLSVLVHRYPDTVLQHSTSSTQAAVSPVLVNHSLASSRVMDVFVDMPPIIVLCKIPNEGEDVVEGHALLEGGNSSS